MNQPFKTLDEFVRRHRLVLPRPRDDWRLVQDPLVGQINGLPRLVGATIATNGILVALLGSDGTTVQVGHLQWFEPDPTEQNIEFSDLYDNATIKPPRRVKLCPTLQDYFTW